MRETPTLSELKRLGLKSQQLLANVGITTVQQLEELGAVAAYLRAKGANPGVTLNLLWGLESALTGIPRQEVAHSQRARLLRALEESATDGV